MKLKAEKLYKMYFLSILNQFLILIVLNGKGMRAMIHLSSFNIIAFIDNKNHSGTLSFLH